MFRTGTTIKEDRKVDLYRRCAQLKTMSEKLENLEGLLKGNFPVEIGKTLDQQLKDIFKKMPIANADYKYMMSKVKETIKDYAKNKEQTAAHRGPLDTMESLWHAILIEMDMAIEQDEGDSTIRLTSTCSTRFTTTSSIN